MPDGARAVPDVVLACAGDIPTQETLAAAWLLQEHLPGLVVRVVNVMDAMVLPPRDAHPHGLSSEKFEELFTADREVIMAWHGYARPCTNSCMEDPARNGSMSAATTNKEPQPPPSTWWS
ncbi:probable phosphoketolase [Arthrobacter sp. Hiyo8]|nr:probable phosphoketolase [Arthrobacter sp. Hiyo8]